MTSWRIGEIDERQSQSAGDLIRTILADEFGAALTTCSDSDLDDMYAAYTKPLHACWVGVDSGNVVGVAAVRDTPGGALELKRFYVDAAQRGTGLANALLGTVHDWAAAQSFQQIVLTTTDVMARARSFYERNGYSCHATDETGAITLHRYRRNLPLAAAGSRVTPDEVPPHGEDGVAVVVERPRGRLEGWHHQGETGDLLLAEHYPIPVPVNYGYIPAWTNPADGEALDAIILDDRRMRPGEAAICVPVGVLHRPDGDDKLLVLPKEGAVLPVNVNEAFRDRVSAWWGEDEQPVGWSGREGVSALLAKCKQSEVNKSHGA